jgi:hypothetical protein
MGRPFSRLVQDDRSGKDAARPTKAESTMSRVTSTLTERRAIRARELLKRSASRVVIDSADKPADDQHHRGLRRVPAITLPTTPWTDDGKPTRS